MRSTTTTTAHRPTATRRISRRATLALALLAGCLGAGRTVAEEPPAQTPPRDFSGWRGGIGITFGTPSRDIADVTEMGYDLAWGSEDPRAIKALGISVFRYWNSIVETSLKGPGYDFSALPDKEQAAKQAFDAWMERTYGVKGLSKFASVRYHPKGSYGDVYGSMDLSSDNPLVKAVIDKYMRDFDRDGIIHGGIGLDNAGKVPKEFLETLTRRLNARGLGIAANGCPDEYLPFIDFFGNEGFPFSIQYARQAQAKGLRGILGEFTMQHLSGGELDAYLKSKLFNGIVFFGYTNGGTAAGARYSSYCVRPDVYDHQRWILRKIVPISRAVQRAGRQENPCAKLASAATAESAALAAPTGVNINAEGKVVEWNRHDAGLDRISGRFSNTAPAVVRFGDNLDTGLYLFIDSGRPEEVICDANALGLRADTLVFDEFNGAVLTANRQGDTLTFKTAEGPRVVRLGSARAIARGLVERASESLRSQLAQRALDREMGVKLTRRPWSRFCLPGKWESTQTHSGKLALAVSGDTYNGPMPQWKYFNRQGVAQFVTLNQSQPQPIEARAWSKAQGVAAAEPVVLDTPAARRKHFDAREGQTYAMHLYLDYQDGHWPEFHSVSFSPGTHDWEQKRLRVEPTRPVKTAMVLLEFHQPQGAAWFDDVSLTSGGNKNETAPNRLAAPGFEDGDPAAAEALAIAESYNRRAKALLEALETASRASTPALPALEKQVQDLAETISTPTLAPHFSRERRDLAAAREHLELCARLLAPR